MILFSSALQSIEHLARRLRERTPLETVALGDAVGAVIGETIRCPAAVPPFANSAMDGFAVRAAETERTLSLRIAGSIAAGDAPPFGVDLPPGFAFEIMTGAPVPDSYDSVIKVEETAQHHSSHGPVVTLARAAVRGENVRRAGEDFAAGQVVVEAGTVLHAEHVLVLATLGIARVSIRRRPRVALISTGPELVELGTPGPLTGARIFNSTAPYLRAVLPAMLGAQVDYHGTIADDAAAFLKLLDQVRATEPDLILTTGAVSMGKHDFVLPALREARAEVLFHKVAVRPGKPILFAHFRDSATAFFGLPGNPISTAVGARFFVEPYVRQLQGRPAERPRPLVLRNALEKPEGLRCFFKGKLDLQTGEAQVLTGQASSLVHPLLQANGWVVLEEGRARWREGDRVYGVPFQPLPAEGDAAL